MMGQQYKPGVNHALFNRQADTDIDGGEDWLLEFENERGDGVGESVQRKRRHRSGSKPPWLRQREEGERIER